MQRRWISILLDRSPKRLIRVAAIAFALLVMPVWFIRAYRASQSPAPDALTQLAPTTIERQLPAILVRVFAVERDQVVDMDLEEYLIGVVAAEMPASYEIEALKAQAVAARTFVVQKMNGFSGVGCARGGDICTDSNHCQAYRDPSERSANWGTNAAINETRIRTAVYETAGQIVTYESQPIEAFFHSTAGGMTEDSGNAFSESLPYLKSVPSDETDAPRYENALELSYNEFVRVVNQSYPKAKLKAKSLKNDIDVIARFESGRIDRVRLGQTEISGKQLRSLFALDSSNVAFEFTSNGVILRTKGYGHGVGMSQTGANAMAAQGASFAEILQYYYQGTQLSQLTTD